MEFLADFLVEFPVESIIQGLVLEAWEEEELWDLEENHLSQVLDFWEGLEQVLEELWVLALGQVLGPFLQAPTQGQVLWCQGEQQEPLRLIKLPPKLGLGLVALAESPVALALVESPVALALAESLVALALAESLGVLVVLVASVA